MATLKGKWLLNDLITAPIGGEDISCDVSFCVHVNNDHYGVDDIANCYRFRVSYNGKNVYYYSTLTGEWLEDSTLVAYTTLGWSTFDYGNDIQTITFTEEQEVSEEFYAWFTANASPVADGKKIAGVWKFKDEIAAPIGGVASGGVNFTTEALGYTAHCIDLYVGEYPEMTYVVDSVPGELEQYLGSLGITLPFPFVVVNGGVWDVDSFGEGVKTIDFGTDPQTVSNEFYGWMIANAERQDPPAATITHNGETIAELDPGQTATLKCAGMKMAGDVVVRVAELPESEGSTGAVAFNIAYGDTEPTDTSKLWVKTSDPAAVQVSTKAEFAGEELQTNVAALPTAASAVASVMVGTKVYLFGGTNGYGSFLNTINVFDTESKTVSTLSTALPTAAAHIAVAAVGTKVYLFGGQSGANEWINTINVFDAENNTISTLSAVLPQKACAIAAAAVGTKVYLFGGKYSSYLDTINVFDTESNTISKLSTTLPAKGGEIAAVAVGAKVYLFGGYGYVSSMVCFSTINVFDTESKTINTLDTSLPTAAATIAAVAIGTKIYLFGGYGRDTSGSFRLDTINVFNPENDTIGALRTTLPTAACEIATVAVGGKVYLFGGRQSANSNYLQTINAFVLIMEIGANNLFVEISSTKNLFSLLPNVELGVANVYKGNADGYAEKVPAALYVDGAWTEV
jgi:N-acetylneuraminic acid mutarotase